MLPRATNTRCWRSRAWAAPDIGLIDDPFDKGLLSNGARLRGFNHRLMRLISICIWFRQPALASPVSPTMAGVSFKNAVPASGQDSI